jgi:PAS domain S-box-containing protein
MDKHNLGAAEQQLKAANQQLKASEQQLKAANQQLQATNQQLKATEEELRKSRRRYKAMFESTINAIAVYRAVDNDRDFIVHNFNRAAEKLENTTKEEVIGKSVLQVLPQVKKFGLFEVCQRVWKSGKAEQYLETLHRDGVIQEWRENYVFKLPSGEIVVVYEDITKRRRAEEARREEHNLLRTLIDIMPDLIYIKDTKSRFVIANNAVGCFMGLATPDELIGRTDFEFYPKELASQFYESEQRIISTGKPTINREERIKGKSGDVKWILTTKMPWRDSHGEIVGTVGVGRDITERKEAEEMVRAANQQLEAANQQLRAGEQQLKAVNQQLRASEQQLRAANQQLQANEQQLRAANQQLQASENELLKTNYSLKKRIKELRCIYGLYHLERKHRTSIEQICEDLLDLIPTGWQYPEATSVQIILDGQTYETNGFKQSPWSQCADIEMGGEKFGTIRICYIEEKPASDEGPFLIEERQLLDALAEHLGDIIKRSRAEEKLLAYQRQLKSLASKLTLAEEHERRRIATELHDHISQHLVASKVNLQKVCESVSSKGLIKTLNEVCEALKLSIQNTRSLTFDLSSPILHELGFEAAVAEWLTEKVEEQHGILTEFKSDDKPKPLDEDIGFKSACR